jgi:hypothetical protein
MGGEGGGHIPSVHGFQLMDHILMSPRLVLPPTASGIDEEENLWYL